MLNTVKQDLRIKHALLDTEIQLNIDACETDLRLAGVNVVSEQDALTQKAILLYCRWQFNFENAAERYQKAYESLKITMALAGDYTCTTT